MKSIIDDREVTAETQEEKVKLLTNIWSNVYQISHLENQQFCKINENKVKSHLNSVTDKITPKWIINFNELENNNNDYLNLKIDIDDVKFSIKSLKDKCPGPSKLRKNHFLKLPDNILHNISRNIQHRL